jgi:hypothetical protein
VPTNYKPFKMKGLQLAERPEIESDKGTIADTFILTRIPRRHKRKKPSGFGGAFLLAACGSTDLRHHEQTGTYDLGLLVSDLHPPADKGSELLKNWRASAVSEPPYVLFVGEAQSSSLRYRLC